MNLFGRTFSVEKYPPMPIFLNELDPGRGPFCMSFGLDSEALVNSIQAVGLIHAPLVTKESSGGWAIVTGHRRIDAVKRLGWREIPCRDISEARLSPLECLLLGLHENLGGRTLNNVEKGMVLERLSQHVSQEELAQHYPPLLGLPSNRQLLETLIRVVQEFPEGLLMFAATGALSMPTCRVLLDMSPTERESMAWVLSTVPLNRNQQRQFIGWIADLSETRDRFVSHFLAGESVRLICEDPRLNGPQKASALLRLLRKEKFPLLTQAEHRWGRAVAGLQLPKGVRIRHDPGFESPSYVLEVEFSGGAGLHQLLRELARKKGWENLGDPWEAES